jgi:hypothetical protein
MTLKSFLDWFGKGDDDTGGPDSGDWREKRGGNRVELDQERTLGVNLRVPAGGEKADVIAAKVRNVSMRGCRLEMDTAADRKRLYPAQILVASLDVESFSIPLQVEVVRLVGEREAALRFKPPFPRELERLEKFLEPRCLGRSLREIDPGALQRTADVGKGLRWFQGVNDTNLFSWLTSSGHVVQQQLIFLEHVVEWKAGESVKTGRVRADYRPGGFVQSELLDFDDKPDAAVLAQAKAMIEASRIDPVVRDAFLNKAR